MTVAPNSCPYCDGVMTPTEMACDQCQVSVRAQFGAAPLSRLPTEHQRFIEMFVLASGSLKEIAAHAGVSYPTVRNRLDKVIEALRSAIAASPDTEKRLEAGKPGRELNRTAIHRIATKKTDDPTAAEIIKRIS